MCLMIEQKLLLCLEIFNGSIWKLNDVSFSASALPIIIRTSSVIHRSLHGPV